MVLFDGIIEQRLAEALPSHERAEIFEFLAFEQILKDYDLSREELESGWVDGANDGGVDGFFTLINGHLLRDPENFAWPKRTASMDVILITAKHHATFQQAPLNSLLATLPQFFDLARDRAELKGKYSDSVLASRTLFHHAYRRLAAVNTIVSFRFAYALRGDTSEVAENVASRAAQTVALAESFFSSSTATFSFIGATELVTLYRRAKTFALSLPFVEYLSCWSRGFTGGPDDDFDLHDHIKAATAVRRLPVTAGTRGQGATVPVPRKCDVAHRACPIRKSRRHSLEIERL